MRKEKEIPGKEKGRFEERKERFEEEENLGKGKRNI